MTFSILVRRTHMYSALFLTPWILMYALAVFGVNHRDIFMKNEGPATAFAKEREMHYPGVFSHGAEPKMIAEQILQDLDLEGTYAVRQNEQQGVYTIIRRDPITPRRITYTPAEEKLVVERRRFRTVGFLAGLHHRAGYRSDQFMEDSWAFGVDLAIAGMIFWALSGLWIWWELKVTRRWGLVSLMAGSSLFLFFLVTI